MKKKIILWAVFAAIVLFLFLAPHQNVRLVDIAHTFAGPSAEH